ncbi:MAG: hypothetical protein CXZ00_10070 [Acidobacteria bacterium]|nr:MAG: hypothetical protein CXZ00_10070 [Acidobacteriota bacterium]
MKLKLIIATILFFGSLAHAQGAKSNFSIGAGIEGVFPAASFNRNPSAPENSTVQKGTNAVGYIGDLRYDFGRHSAVGIAVTWNRNTEVFFDGFTTATNHVQTNNAEIIASYIIRLPARERVKPYFMIGGGVVHFSPTNDFSTADNPSSQSKPTFAYGFGTDLNFNANWALRLQYRGLVLASPDFGLMDKTDYNNFGSGVKRHVPEPSVQIVYHF